MVLFAQCPKILQPIAFFYFFFFESKNFDFFLFYYFLSPNPNLQQQQKLKNQGEIAINNFSNSVKSFNLNLIMTYNIHFKPA